MALSDEAINTARMLNGNISVEGMTRLTGVIDEIQNLPQGAEFRNDTQSGQTITAKLSQLQEAVGVIQQQVEQTRDDTDKYLNQQAQINADARRAEMDNFLSQYNN